MESLPSDIQDKILFPKYYKCKNNLTLNEKICLSLNLQKQRTISRQINSLVKEFDYQRNRCDYNMWSQTKHPSYIFILYRCLAKKNKEHTLDLTRKNYFSYLNNNIYNNIYNSITYIYGLHRNLFNSFINITHTNNTINTNYTINTNNTINTNIN